MTGPSYQDPDTWWGEYGPLYAERSWREYRWLLADVVAHAEEGPLLDVGCGYGFVVECARRFGMAAIGLEASPAALATCRERHPEAEVRSWRAGAALPVESGTIGVVLANEFVDHITRDENELLLRETHRVLKPGGLLMVRSPSRHNRFDHDLGHVSFFSPSEFRAFVESFSFDVVSQPYVPQPLLGRSRAGKLAMRIVSGAYRPERWAARIDLVARRRDPAASGRGGA